MEIDKINNIVLFAPSLYSGGGTERVLVNLANNLIEYTNVIILVNDIGNRKLYNLNSAVKIKKYQFGSLRFRYPANIFFKVINKFFGTILLQRFFKDLRYDDTNIVICFSPGITNDCIKTKFKDKLISFEHWPFSAYNKFPKVQRTIKKNFPFLKKVVVLTEHEKKIYKDLGCDVIVIPNVYSFFPDEPAKLKNNVILSIGHFNEQKRRDLLINCWRLVNKENPSWQLHIVGDGNLKQQAINQIYKLGLQHSIKIIDPTQDILTHYLSSSIFVLSSEFEALPLVLIEAKAVGLPCVSFDIVSGPIEIINNNKDGFVVDFPNVQKMADKINLLIENKQLRLDFGRSGRLDALARYNPQAIYKLWYELLNNVLD